MIVNLDTDHGPTGVAELGRPAQYSADRAFLGRQYGRLNNKLGPKNRRCPVPEEIDPGFVPSDIQRAWDVVLGARMEVGRTLGEPLSGSEELRLEGIVAPGGISARNGPIVAIIKCSDGAKWVIDYDEQSPYHAFAGRRVVASGFPCEPPSEHVIGVRGHFAVSKMRLAEVASDAWLTEVGAGHLLSGRFDGGAGDAGEAGLSFVTGTGDTFLVANNPAGVTTACTVRALCYPVRLSPGIAKPHQQYLWVICPWSYAELWGLRGRPDAGLPPDVYVDAGSGQVRHRRPSAEPSAAADPGRM